jgi:hypothetical protein
VAALKPACWLVASSLSLRLDSDNQPQSGLHVCKLMLMTTPARRRNDAATLK